MSEGTSPNTLSTQPSSRDGGSSRGSSPEEIVEILEHSMESLIVSDSSEDCILTEEVTPGLTLRLDVEDADSEQLGNVSVNILGEEDEEPPQFEENGEAPSKEEVQEEGKPDTKRKKRRISSRRERKISLTSSDRVVRKIAGVEVKTFVLFVHLDPLHPLQACL